MNRKLVIRVLALCLVLLMALSLLPLNAFAEGFRVTAPYTGDENNITIWIVLIVVALIAIAAAVFLLLKKGKKK